MAQTIVLIDYESVGAAGLQNLPPQSRVMLFIGRTNVLPKNSDIENLLLAARRVDIIKIAGLGKDNLDHHLALYLGKTIALEPHGDYVIISNDKSGFDPLAKHVNDVLGISCKRITPVKKPASKPAPAAKAAKPAPAKPAADPLDKIRAAFRAAKISDLPRTKPAMLKFIRTALGVDATQAGQIKKQLLDEKFCTKSDKGRFTFAFEPKTA